MRCCCCGKQVILHYSTRQYIGFGELRHLLMVLGSGGWVWCMPPLLAIPPHASHGCGVSSFDVSFHHISEEAKHLPVQYVVMNLRHHGSHTHHYATGRTGHAPIPGPALNATMYLKPLSSRARCGGDATTDHWI